MNQNQRRAPLVPMALVALGVALTAALALTPYLAGASNPKLSTAYPYLAGDDIAHRMGSVFRVTAGLPTTAFTDYDRKARVLTVEIMGSAEEVEGAKREIEAFVTTIRERIGPYAKERHGIALDDRDVTLIYWNDGGDEAPYEVVRRQDGKYVVPAGGASGDD